MEALPRNALHARFQDPVLVAICILWVIEHRLIQAKDRHHVTALPWYHSTPAQIVTGANHIGQQLTDEGYFGRIEIGLHPTRPAKISSFGTVVTHDGFDSIRQDLDLRI